MRMKLIGFAIVAVPSVALACLHATGGEAAQPVTQSGQQAIVVHHDGVEDLVLQVDYQGLASQTIGWIVPVPATPSEYGVGELQLFRDVGEWVNLRRQRPQPRGLRSRGTPTQAAAATLRFGEPARVGPFDIQPIQGFGSGAANALNEWMRANDFQPLPTLTLSYYVQRNWTFLAIKATPEEGAELDDAGGLPPLRITFPSERAVYPLKLSTHMGAFGVRIYLFTSEPVRAEAFAGARERGFEVATGGIHLRHPASKPGTLRSDVAAFEVASAPPTLRPLLARVGERAHLSVLLNEDFNQEPRAGVEMRSAHWAEDLSVPGVGEGEVLVGSADTEADTEAEAEAEAAEAETEAASEAETEAASEPDDGLCSASGSPGFTALLCLVVLLERSRRKRA